MHLSGRTGWFLLGLESLQLGLVRGGAVYPCGPSTVTGAAL